MAFQEKYQMERFVDTHCHIIFGVDDGAQTPEEMQKMLRMAYEDGIRYIIATPHHHPRRGRKAPGVLRKQLKIAREEAAKISDRLRVYLGTEVYFGQDAPEGLREGKILTMNRTNFVLVEFSHSDTYEYICQGLQQLQMKGFEVILAHVERYGCMCKSLEDVEHLTHMGVRLQVNADSITGENGYKTASGPPACILRGHRRSRRTETSAADAGGRRVRNKKMWRRICEEDLLQQCENDAEEKEERR